MKKKKTNIHNLIDKLAAEENSFLKSEFLCPVLKGQPVRVRISGIIMSMRVAPVNFQGWGVFKPVGRHLAKHVRKPSMAERRQYLGLFPTLRFVLSRQENDVWFGVPANQSDTRFRITGSVPVQLSEEIQVFDTVCSRFDGNICWFDEVDPRKSPKNGNYLRESLREFTKPDKLQMDGLTKEEIDAYQIAYHIAYESSEEAKANKETEKIKTALVRAGADYRGHIDRGDTYTIEYLIDGNPHRSVVNKENLSVVSAGICLSGHDRDFDLQSLVCVIREGHEKDHVVNTEGRNWNQYGYDPDRARDYEEDDDW
jgi:hypothetical protein